MSESVYWTWLSTRLGAASPYLAPLVTKFVSAKAIYEADRDALLSVERLPERIRLRLLNKELSRSERILEDCKRLGIGVLTYSDSRYPSVLKYIATPPALLYFKGQPVDFDKRLCIGVVGTRTMSEYGRDMAYRLGYDLASAGAVIVSGMALGIDGMSAAGALDAQAETVAVLGCGLDRVYPAVHAKLCKSILNDGFLLSEYPPGTEPDGRNFPQRNRLISGLSRCTLVVEAPTQSGALITARNAIRQGRPVFAVPGNVGLSNSAGTNELIKNGARLVTCAADILTSFDPAAFPDVDVCAIGSKRYDSERAMRRYGVSAGNSGIKFIHLRKPAAEPDEFAEEAAGLPQYDAEKTAQNSEFIMLPECEKAVYDCLPEEGGVSVDMLVSATGQTVADVSMHLISLSVKGLAVSLPGNRYCRSCIK